MTYFDRTAWEVRNERNKAHVRWLLVLVVAGYLTYLVSEGISREIGSTALLTDLYVAALTGTAMALNIFFTFVLYQVRKNNGRLHKWFKYATMLVDLGLVSALLIPTGGSESLFFPVYFIVIVSNSIRYGMKGAVVGLFGFNLMYVGVLYEQYYPEMQIPSLQKEVMKVAGLWLVGIYTGYLSKRFDVLQQEVAKYESLVEKLMQKKEA